MSGKKGLVLEGGAMRGMFSSGVMDVMLENNIVFDGAIGVSAGATFGCNYKSRQIGRAIRYNKRFCRDSRYGTVRSVLRYGDIYEPDFCYNQIPFALDLFDTETYRSNPLHFYVVVSEGERGIPVVHEIPDGNAEDLLWMRASASMPLVSRPVLIEGKHYLDGGMTSSIPLRTFEEMGHDKNVVVLTQPREYRKKPNKAAPFIRLMLRKFPKLAEAMVNRHVVYNKEKDYVFQQEKAGRALVLCPEADLGISRTEHNPDELERIYQLGRQTAEKHMAEIKAFLQ